MADTIRNPIEWVEDQLQYVADGIAQAGRSVRRTCDHLWTKPLAVQKIEISDLKDVLRKGFEDFGAYRTDVIFLLIIYPVVSLIFARAASDTALVPLLFPLASGFTIIGPFAAVVLYEMSRRRELSQNRQHESRASWANLVSVLRSRNFTAIMMLGLVLIGIFLLWLAAASTIYQSIHGPRPVESIDLFVYETFTTSAGLWLIVLGCGVGFLFAVLTMFISVVSFPLLLDRDVGLITAIMTSVHATMTNLIPMAAWGLIVAAALLLGAIPLFLGLVVVLPVLGHATWHLYRKLVPRTHEATAHAGASAGSAEPRS